MTSIAENASPRRVAIGIDTHKFIHVAVALDERGTILGDIAVFVDHKIIEVTRPDRRDRRLRGKSDVLDAENAARAVLAGSATAVPKSADGVVEMPGQIKVAKDTAVKARTSAMITLKALVMTAPPELGEELRALSKMVLIERCLALRPGNIETPLAAAKHALRSLARRWRDLSAEIKEHEALLSQLTR